MRDIAKCFSITMPSATALIDKLIEMKFVFRKNDETDRRIVKISLTKQGEKLLEEAMKQRMDKINKFLVSLSKKDKEDLLRILQKITA
jgi:DNA-binding MarR family transcriptional regulator